MTDLSPAPVSTPGAPRPPFGLNLAADLDDLAKQLGRIRLAIDLGTTSLALAEAHDAQAKLQELARQERLAFNARLGIEVPA